VSVSGPHEEAIAQRLGVVEGELARIRGTPA
jgi:hypothetical protein